MAAKAIRNAGSQTVITDRRNPFSCSASASGPYPDQLLRLFWLFPGSYLFDPPLGCLFFRFNGLRRGSCG